MINEKYLKHELEVYKIKLNFIKNFEKVFISHKKIDDISLQKLYVNNMSYIFDTVEPLMKKYPKNIAYLELDISDIGNFKFGLQIDQYYFEIYSLSDKTIKAFDLWYEKIMKELF